MASTLGQTVTTTGRVADGTESRVVLRSGITIVRTEGLGRTMLLAIGLRGMAHVVSTGIGKASIVLVPRRGGHSAAAICGDCGYMLLVADAEQLGHLITQCCPGCMAAVLDGCSVGHTWGSCRLCPARVDSTPQAA